MNAILYAHRVVAVVYYPLGKSHVNISIVYVVWSGLDRLTF